MGRVDADGVGIDYEVVGQGQPVVLLHGWPDSGRSWRHQVPALAAAGFQVVVPDLRGYGRSGKPEAAESYSLPVATGDVLAILADLNIARAHLVGHDGGAALAWQLALIAPAASTTWSYSRSATPSPSAARCSSARSPGTCCCSSSPASPNAG